MTPREVRLTRLVPAPVEDVFAAWTDPVVLSSWWGAGENEVSFVETDPRPGGTYRLIVRTPDEVRFVLRGTYVEVDPPHRLSFTWEWEAGGPGDSVTSQVTVELRPAGDATELVLTHGGFPDDAIAAPYGRGWEPPLARLVALFE
jgi:uncharacterized protein YndB with AHSA1/START domain